MPYQKIAPASKIVGSPQQDIVWGAISKDSENIVVDARAGTGKTLTMIEGLKKVPSSKSSCFVAFNKSIATELTEKVPKHSRACTLHSLGNAAIREAGYRPQLNQYKTHDLIEKFFGRSYLSKPQVNALAKLIGYCKNTGTDPLITPNLLELAFSLGIDDWITTEMYHSVNRIMSDSMGMTHVIDFDDMIWLPIVLNLPIRKYDFLVVDEAQDLNRIQQSLALYAGRRIVIVGDVYQSIYAFRGADVESMRNMTGFLDSNGGVATYPLTVSRRCPKAAVRLVRPIVPDFECLDDAIEGEIKEATVEKMLDVVKGGDMVLSRVNAPLLSLAYRLLRREIPAKIQGRDIGEGLRSLINRLESDSNATVTELLAKLKEWEEIESSRILAAYRHNVEAKLMVLQDRIDCIRSLTEGFTKVGQVTDRITSLFTDDRDVNRKSVLLSSVHKAKGLEADHVWVANPEVLPHPMAKTSADIQQEHNLAYVAGTRFKKTITFLGKVPEVFGR